MDYIALDFTLTAEGIDARHPFIGKVATIVRELNPGVVNAWYVRPYRFAIHERGTRWQSVEAAKAYALALAYEAYHRQELGAPPPPDHERAPAKPIGASPREVVVHENTPTTFHASVAPLPRTCATRTPSGECAVQCVVCAKVDDDLGRGPAPHYRPIDRSLAERPPRPPLDLSRLHGPDGEDIPLDRSLDDRGHTVQAGSVAMPGKH